MNIVTQRAKPSRLLDYFELRTEEDRSPRTKGSLGDSPSIPGAIEVGCVDWYLYPVNEAVQRTER